MRTESIIWCSDVLRTCVLSFRELEDNEVRDLHLKALEKFYMKRETLNENSKRMYGKIMSICNYNLYDRSQRLPDFVEVRGKKDAARF